MAFIRLYREAGAPSWDLEAVMVALAEERLAAFDGADLGTRRPSLPSPGTPDHRWQTWRHLDSVAVCNSDPAGAPGASPSSPALPRNNKKIHPFDDPGAPPDSPQGARPRRWSLHLPAFSRLFRTPSDALVVPSSGADSPRSPAQRRAPALTAQPDGLWDASGHAAPRPAAGARRGSADASASSMRFVPSGHSSRTLFHESASDVSSFPAAGTSPPGLSWAAEARRAAPATREGVRALQTKELAVTALPWAQPDRHPAKADSSKTDRTVANSSGSSAGEPTDLAAAKSPSAFEDAGMFEVARVPQEPRTSDGSASSHGGGGGARRLARHSSHEALSDASSLLSSRSSSDDDTAPVAAAASATGRRAAATRVRGGPPRHSGDGSDGGGAAPSPRGFPRGLEDLGLRAWRPQPSAAVPDSPSRRPGPGPSPLSPSRAPPRLARSSPVVHVHALMFSPGWDHSQDADVTVGPWRAPGSPGAATGATATAAGACHGIGAPASPKAAPVPSRRSGVKGSRPRLLSVSRSNSLPRIPEEEAAGELPRNASMPEETDGDLFTCPMDAYVRNKSDPGNLAV